MASRRYTGGDEKLVILICIDVSGIIDTGGKALQLLTTMSTLPLSRR